MASFSPICHQPEQVTLWDLLGEEPVDLYPPKKQAAPLIVDEQPEEPEAPEEPEEPDFVVTCLTKDMGHWMDRHPADRLERRDGIPIVASPPFCLDGDGDDGYPPDEFLGQYPIDRRIGRALVFRRAVSGGEDGYEAGRLYVLIRYRDDPEGVPSRLPIPHSLDEAIGVMADRLIEKGAREWGYDPGMETDPN